MQCSQCHKQVEQSYRFCPYCGAKVASDIEEVQEHPVVKKRKMPIWFKFVLFLAVLALTGVTAGILFTESWVDVVDHQLEALRGNDVEKAYYSYTSKEFQDTTSLVQFRHFIEAYPVFFDNQSAHFSQRSIHHNIGTLRGYLTSNDHVNTSIEYKLIREEGRWKILSIRLLKPKNIPSAKEAGRTEDLIEAIKGQLKLIQDKKLDEAYQDYSSKEFKETTSEQAFGDFIKRYPILSTHHIVSFHKPTIRNGVGTLAVIVQSDQIAAYVKYYLIFEEGKWKIWSMRILSPTEKGGRKESISEGAEGADQEPMSFGAVALGNAVDKQGKVEEVKQPFLSDLGDLYVDIEVKNGVKGSIIYLRLQHAESGSSIPAEAAIEENGDSMLLSVFSPPAHGWPKGGYKLMIKTSSGLSKEVDFEIH